MLAVLYGAAVALDQFSAGRLDYPVLSTMPLLAAAALMFVAPREKLIALAAISFAWRPVVELANIFFQADNHDILRMTGSAYADLQVRVLDVTALLASLSWLIVLIGVLALAFYIGPVRSRIGWFIVLLGLVVAANGWVVIIVQRAQLLDTFGADAGALNGLDPLNFLLIPALGQLTAIASAYLTAAAFDHRLRLLALSYGLGLGAELINVAIWVGYAILPPGQAPIDQGISPSGFYPGDWILPVFWMLGLASAILLVAGILFELPRNKVRAADAGDADIDLPPVAPGNPTETFGAGQ